MTEADNDNDIDLATLAERADVNPRTVRYYIQQGLLPSPGKGAGTRYDAGLVDRLRLIKEFQRQHLPLSEIRARLELLDEEEEGVARALGKPLELDMSDSALSYVRRLMETGDQQRYLLEPEPSQGKLSSMRASRMSAPAPQTPRQQAVIARHVAPQQDKWQVTKSTWERVRLSRDVELSIRRPLTREQNKLVDRLLEAAAKIFSEEP